MPMPLVPEDRARPEYRGSTEFNSLLRHFLCGRGDLVAALDSAQADKTCPARVREVLKASVAAGSLADPVWAGTLGEYQRIVSAYVESLSSVSAFDRILSDGAFMRVPPGSVISITTQAAVGSVISEGSIVPISSLTLSAPKINLQKALALVVVSDALARDPAATGLIGRELQRSVAKATDTAAIAAIVAAGTSTPTTGPTLNQLIDDIRAMFNAIAIGDDSRLYFVLNSALAAALSARAAGSAGWDLRPIGGTLAGVDVIISSGAPTGNLILIDASRFAAASDTITLDTSMQASLQLNTSPDSPPTGSTTLVNLWQHNLVGAKAARFFGIQALTANASATTTGMS